MNTNFNNQYYPQTQETGSKVTEGHFPNTSYNSAYYNPANSSSIQQQSQPHQQPSQLQPPQQSQIQQQYSISSVHSPQNTMTQFTSGYSYPMDHIPFSLQNNSSTQPVTQQPIQSYQRDTTNISESTHLQFQESQQHQQQQPQQRQQSRLPQQQPQIQNHQYFNSFGNNGSFEVGISNNDSTDGNIASSGGFSEESGAPVYQSNYNPIHSPHLVSPANQITTNNTSFLHQQQSQTPIMSAPPNLNFNRSKSFFSAYPGPNSGDFPYSYTQIPGGVGSNTGVGSIPPPGNALIPSDGRENWPNTVTKSNSVSGYPQRPNYYQNNAFADHYKPRSPMAASETSSSFTQGPSNVYSEGISSPLPPPQQPVTTNIPGFGLGNVNTGMINSINTSASVGHDKYSQLNMTKLKPKLIRTATLSKNKHYLDSPVPKKGALMYPSNVKLKSSHSSDAGSATSTADSNIDGSESYTNIMISLTGHLESALSNWTPEEIKSKRRLLLFDWELIGSVLHISFRPISQSEYVPKSPVISCIYWDYKNEYYVTSVDVIFLLEQLSGNETFDIKEKNRIRRNLQTLESLTIGKTTPSGDPQSKQFSNSGRNFIKHTINPVEVNKIFDMIMKYDRPKPRRIEKDIKIYKWALLEEALLRVLTKYCFNYKNLQN